MNPLTFLACFYITFGAGLLAVVTPPVTPFDYVLAFTALGLAAVGLLLLVFIITRKAA
jgi:hypothetical protein